MAEAECSRGRSPALRNPAGSTALTLAHDVGLGRHVVVGSGCVIATAPIAVASVLAATAMANSAVAILNEPRPEYFYGSSARGYTDYPRLSQSPPGLEDKQHL